MEEAEKEGGFTKNQPDHENEAMFQITQYAIDGSQPLDDANEITLNQSLRSMLGVVFNNVPNLVSSALAAGTMLASNNPVTYYTLKLDPAMAKGFANGTLSLMPAIGGGVRGEVVDAKGIIRGQVSLMSASGFNALAATTFAWQLVSLVTVPKYLSDINRQLTELNSQVTAVKDFIEEKEFTTITGNIDYLREVHHNLGSHQPDAQELSHFFSQFETIERETLQTLNLFETRLGNICKAVKDHKLGRIVSVIPKNKKAKGLQDPINDYTHFSEGFLLALFVRVTVAQVKGALPGGNYDLSMDRLANTRTRLAKWQDQQIEFYNLINSRIPELKSLLTGENLQSDFSLQASLGKMKTADTFQQLDTAIGNIEQSLTNWYNLPTSIVVELNSQGQFNRVFRLSEPISQRFNTGS